MLRRTDHGRMVFANPDGDKPILEVRTLQCCHCGGHFPANERLTRAVTAAEAKLAAKDGRTARGWCSRCCGPVCGPGCAECIPVEMLLENYEHNWPLDHRVTVVSFNDAQGLSLSDEL